MVEKKGRNILRISTGYEPGLTLTKKVKQTRCFRTLPIIPIPTKGFVVLS